jgi:hypothetical protein
MNAPSFPRFPQWCVKPRKLKVSGFPCPSCLLNERHLRRLAQDYLRYYHVDRTHDGLNKDTPAKRPTLAGMAEIGFNRRLASAVFTIDILGQELHEVCA